MSRAASLVNPVLARELTERMRGPRAMVMLSAYLGVLGLVLVLVYRGASSVGNSRFAGSPVTELATVGQELFEWTLFFAILLVLFLVPGFTAGSVAGERERQTLVPMQVSLLRPVSIVLGKIGASAIFTLLLVLATLPLLTVTYLIGGVTLSDIARGLGMVMFTALTIAAVSVACSTFMKRVQTATVVSYGLVLVLCGATFAAFFVTHNIYQARDFDRADPPRLILAPNPIAALADVTTDAPDVFGGEFGFGSFGYQGSINGPLTGIRELLAPDVFVDFAPAAFDGDFGVAFDGDVSGPLAQAGGLPGQGGMPLWAQHMLIIGALSVLSVILSSMRLRTPAKTER